MKETVVSSLYCPFYQWRVIGIPSPIWALRKRGIVYQKLTKNAIGGKLAARMAIRIG